MYDYNIGLTGEPFLYYETKIIAKMIYEGENPDDLRQRNIKENLMQHKAVGSLSRVNSPVFRRLAVLDKNLLEEFVSTDIDTSKFILLYAIMKTDKLVNEFISEVYKEKLLLKKEYIEKYEFDTFYEEKMLYSEKLKNASESSRYKIRQVMFKILVDSGLLKKENDKFKVVRPLLKQRFIDILEARGDKEYILALKGGGLW